MTHPDDDSLFDPSAPRTPEVTRLETLLRPLGHRGGAAPIVSAPPRTRVPLLLGVACAASLITAAILWTAQPRVPPPHELTAPAAETTPVPACFSEGGRDLAPGSWVVTGDDPREIEVGGVSNVTLGPRTRLQVRHVRDDETRLYLAQGRIEARVSANARPRFFQVDTDAARCVDLGCRYTLDVDDAGTATVRVTTGQVAFENDGREVFVPAGAVCVARKGRGAGTPRFEDASPALQAAFDAYDAAAGARPERRRALASAALATVASGRDTLPAWHLLSDTDAAVAAASHARLSAVAGDAPESEGAARAEIWRQRLAREW